MEMETGNGLMWAQAREHWSHQKLEEENEDSPLEPSKGEWLC